MDPIDPQLIELDSSTRVNLREYLRRELEREYQSKHRSRANKLGHAASEQVQVSGEQLLVWVRDPEKLHKVEMTFPLFDLDADFTFIKCSCLRDALSLEPLRCHHMFYAQNYMAQQLDRLLAEQPTIEPLTELRQLLDSGEDSGEAEERWLLEVRWLMLWEAATASFTAERYVRNRYEPAARWEKQARFASAELRAGLGSFQDALSRQIFEALLRGQNRPERELYELLQLAEGHAALVFEQRESREPISIRSASWQLGISEEAAGIQLAVEIGSARLAPWKIVPDCGLIAWDEAASALYLCPLIGKELSLVQGLVSQTRLIRPEDRELMLHLLEKLDPGVAVLWSETELKSAPVEELQPVLRLTPFRRGGMKLEIWLQISPGTMVQAGVGPELMKERSARGGLRQFIRDFAEEHTLQRRVERTLDLERLPQPEAAVYIAYNDEQALNVMSIVAEHKNTLGLLIEWPANLVQDDKPYAVETVLNEQPLRVAVAEQRDWFALEGWLELEDGRKVALRELLAACRNQRRYLRLSDGKWAVMTEQLRQKLEPLSQSVDAEDDDCRLDLAALQSEASLSALEQLDYKEASSEFWRVLQKARRSQQSETALPEGLTAQLRPYQVDGYKWLSHLAESGLGACLADDMGLGKTLQTLAVLLRFKQRGPSLVIAPSSLSYNWQAEAKRFCPELKVVLIRELEDRGRDRQFLAGELVIASYGLVMRGSTALAKTHWNILVLDEAQAVKNAQTKTAQAVQEITADWRLALSGTPIENHLGELWSLFRSISPGLFGEWDRFRRSYAWPIERDRSAEASQRLQRKIAPFVLRRLKKDYLTELPAKTEIDLWIDLNEDEASYYDALRGEAIEKMAALAADEEAMQKQKIQVLAALTRLRQAACHRTLVDPSWTGSASKLDLLCERLLELKAAGHAALVFSQFTRFLALIHIRLQELGLQVVYLDGQTPVVQRQQLVDSFQAGQGDVFLISLKAGGTGLNLTRASYVFHMDPWWNPAVETQASDRAWRMGQKQAVTVFRLRSRRTIEELIHSLHGEKRQLVESLLVGQDPGARLDWDELWRLFAESPRRTAADQKLSSEAMVQKAEFDSGEART